MELKAKNVSLWSKIFSAFLIIVGTITVGVGWLGKISVLDIVWASLAVAGIFGTIDINLMLEKLRDRGV
jgi:hypothetical protein